MILASIFFSFVVTLRFILFEFYFILFFMKQISPNNKKKETHWNVGGSSSSSRICIRMRIKKK